MTPTDTASMKPFELIEYLIRLKARHRKGWTIDEAYPAMAVKHAREELTEIEEAMTSEGKLEEIADVLGCIYHLAIMLGFSAEQVEREVLRKLRIRFTVDTTTDTASTSDPQIDLASLGTGSQLVPEVNGECPMTIEGMTPWDFCCHWYKAVEIEQTISEKLKRYGSMMHDLSNDRIPTDVASREFAEWMALQYRLAMNKGMELAARALTATNAKLTRQYRDLHSAIYAAPCEATWTDEEHDAAMKMLISIVADPEERWVDERNAGAETVARMILDGKSGERMNDGPIPQALEKVKRLASELERVTSQLNSSLVITPEREIREDDWRRVKRIMMKGGGLSEDEAGIVCRCLDDSMREELKLSDMIRKLERVAAAARELPKPRWIVLEQALASLDQPADGGKGESQS